MKGCVHHCLVESIQFILQLTQLCLLDSRLLFELRFSHLGFLFLGHRRFHLCLELGDRVHELLPLGGVFCSIPHVFIPIDLKLLIFPSSSKLLD